MGDGHHCRSDTCSIDNNVRCVARHRSRRGSPSLGRLRNHHRVFTVAHIRASGELHET